MSLSGGLGGEIWGLSRLDVRMRPACKTSMFHVQSNDHRMHLSHYTNNSMDVPDAHKGRVFFRSTRSPVSIPPYVSGQQEAKHRVATDVSTSSGAGFPQRSDHVGVLRVCMRRRRLVGRKASRAVLQVPHPYHTCTYIIHDTPVPAPIAPLAPCNNDRVRSFSRSRPRSRLALYGVKARRRT